MKKLSVIILIALMSTLCLLNVCAADDFLFWDFSDASVLEQWHPSSGANIEITSDGARIYGSGDNINFQYYNSEEIILDNYRYVVIEYTGATHDGRMQLYHDTENGNYYYLQNAVDMNAGIHRQVFNFETNELGTGSSVHWTGTSDFLRFDPFRGIPEREIIIKYIGFFANKAQFEAFDATIAGDFGIYYGDAQVSGTAVVAPIGSTVELKVKAPAKYVIGSDLNVTWYCYTDDYANAMPIIDGTTFLIDTAEAGIAYYYATVNHSGGSYTSAPVKVVVCDEEIYAEYETYVADDYIIYRDDEAVGESEEIILGESAEFTLKGPADYIFNNYNVTWYCNEGIAGIGKKLVVTPIRVINDYDTYYAVVTDAESNIIFSEQIKVSTAINFNAPIIYDAEYISANIASSSYSSTAVLIPGGAENGLDSALRLTPLTGDPNISITGFDVDLSTYKYIVFKLKSNVNQALATFHYFKRNNGTANQSANGNYYQGLYYSGSDNYLYVGGTLNVDDPLATVYTGMRFDFFNNSGIDIANDKMDLEYIAFFTDAVQFEAFKNGGEHVILPESVTLDNTAITLIPGESRKINLSFSPDNAYASPIVWISSNPEVATVENGVITAIQPGTATITVIVGGAVADCEVTVNDIVTGNCGDNLTWTLDSEGTLTISGTGKMDDYYLDAESAPWEERKEFITNVIIEDGVTHIGLLAFGNCENLQSVSISETVETIGTGAFRYCTVLQSIAIPENLKSIGEAAFNGCTALSTLSLGSSLEYIGKAAFQNCYSIESLVIPDTVETVDDYAFNYCTSLSDIELGSNIKYIGYSAFQKSKVESIVIPDNVITIGGFAFSECTNLASVELGSSVKTIGESAFQVCDISSIVIPDSTTTIGNHAFNMCFKLGDVTLGNALRTIGEEAFSCCFELKNVVLPQNVVSVESLAFKNCKNLERVEIPAATVVIGNDAFDYCNFVTLYGYKDSYAEEYAAENELPFIALDLENAYTIAYHANEGEDAPEAQIKEQGVSVEISSIIPTRNGYEFYGWSIGRSNEVAYMPGQVYNDDQNVVLYAVWTPCTYDVSYNANGGLGAPEPQVKTYDVALTLSNIEPMREGYTFAGWSLTADGEATYKPGAEFTEEHDCVLYAVWEEYIQPIVYNAEFIADNSSSWESVELISGGAENGLDSALRLTPMRSDPYIHITGFNVDLFTYKYIVFKLKSNVNQALATFHYFKRNNGTANQAANGSYYQTISFNASESYIYVSAPLNVLQRDPNATVYTGMRFDFFNNGGINLSIDRMDLEYIAFFTNASHANSYIQRTKGYTISYNANGGSGAPEAQTKLHDTALEISDVIPEKEGYTFKGWSVYADGDVTFNSGDICYYNGSVELYAVWDLAAYTVTWKNEDGTILETDSVLYGTIPEYNGATPEKAPSLLYHYTFNGWDRDITEVNGDTVYTATYTAAPNDPETIPHIKVHTVKAKAGDTVDVKIELGNNPGIISMLLKVTYDNRLTLTEVTNGNVLNGPAHNINNLTKNPYTLSWADDLATENNTANGIIVTLTFEVSEAVTEGDVLPISVSYDNTNAAIFDVNFDLVDFALVNGGIEVIDYIVGDLNDDGQVNAFDRTILSRHIANWPGYSTEDFNYEAADVNKDGKVDAFDRTILTRHVAGWDGYETLPYNS